MTTTDPAPTSDDRPAGAPKPRSDKWVKRGFFIVIAVAVLVVLYFQYRGPMLGWPSNPVIRMVPLATPLAQPMQWLRPEMVAPSIGEPLSKQPWTKTLHNRQHESSTKTSMIGHYFLARRSR